MSLTAPRSVLCLSGGLDSVACLVLHRPNQCLLFSYGQKAFIQEQKAAEFFAAKYGIPLAVIDLPWLAVLSQTSGAVAGHLPQFEDSRQLEDPRRTEESAKAVWVPARNLVFASIAAAWAEAHEFQEVWLGLNAEEAATFPDNSTAFVDALNETLRFATKAKVRVVAPLGKMTKAEIVRDLKKRDVPFDRIWSCYDGGPAPCGRCESCARKSRAFHADSI